MNNCVAAIYVIIFLFNVEPTASPVDIIGTPQDIDVVTFTWAAIPCGNRRGVITQYHYQLEYENETIAREDAVSAQDTDVTLDDLFPCISYIFRIAGTTSVGDGPYSDDVTTSLACKFLFFCLFLSYFSLGLFLCVSVIRISL